MVECGSFSANLCQFTEINGLLSTDKSDLGTTSFGVNKCH